MSLAEASEARKARLAALRKRKAGEAIDEEGCVSFSSLTIIANYSTCRNAEPLIKNRNFDPDSRTIRKHANDDIVMQDTIEVQVKGLTEQILAEDEKLRAQELVRFTRLFSFFFFLGYVKYVNRTCLTSPQNDQTGT